VLQREIELRSGSTVYHRVGDLPFVLAALIVLGLTAIRPVAVPRLRERQRSP
jgi:apolipoprotein N-acyltransferase